MPLALFIIGGLFLISAIRGTQQELFDTLKDDFTGPNNFFFWGLSIFIIGAVGYYRPLRPLSNSFMLLVFIVLMLSNRGFFNKFMAQMGATTGSQLRQSVSGNPNLSESERKHVNGMLGDLSTLSRNFWKR